MRLRLGLLGRVRVVDVMQTTEHLGGAQIVMVLAEARVGAVYTIVGAHVFTCEVVLRQFPRIHV